MAHDDLTFYLNDIDTFNYRVAGYIHSGTKVLLHMSHNSSHWNLVGGRVKIHEDSCSALIRELQEELHHTFFSGQLKIRSVNENFFYHLGRHSTEILVIYDLEIPAGHELTKFKSFEEDKTTYKWYEKSEVVPEKIFCLPVQIYKLVKEDNWTFCHNVVRED